MTMKIFRLDPVPEKAGAPATDREAFSGELQTSLTAELHEVEARFEKKKERPAPEEDVASLPEPFPPQSQPDTVPGTMDVELAVRDALTPVPAKNGGRSLPELEAEVVELRGKLQSQGQILETQFQLLERHNEAENRLKTRIAELESELATQTEKISKREASLQARESSIRQLETGRQDKTQSLAARLEEKERQLEKSSLELEALREKVRSNAKVAELKTRADARMRTMDARLREQDEALKVKDTAIRKMEEKFQDEIEALTKRLEEAAELLERREQTLSVLRNQAKAQLVLLEAYQHTEQEQKSRIAALECSGEGMEAAADEGEEKVSEFRRKVEAKIKSLRAKLWDKEANPI